MVKWWTVAVELTTQWTQARRRFNSKILDTVSVAVGFFVCYFKNYILILITIIIIIIITNHQQLVAVTYESLLRHDIRQSSFGIEGSVPHQTPPTAPLPAFWFSKCNKTGRHDTSNQRQRRHGKWITLYIYETVSLGIHLKHIPVTGLRVA